MQNYFLQLDKKTNKQIIDTEINLDLETLDVVSAENWIEAKKLLGFKLTTEQEIAIDAK